MKSALLDNIKIIEISSGQAASHAAWLLAECGADLIRLEPPGGDVARSRPAFSVFNRSKRSVIVDIEGERGREQLEQLLAGADGVIHDLAPARARALGLDADALQRHPRLIVSGITAMPAGHSMDAMPLVDSLVMAQGGLLQFHDAGRREGPAFQRFPLGSQTSAYLCAIGMLARLYLRRKVGAGGAVSTSLLQGCMTVLMMLRSRPQFATEGFTLAPSSFNPLVECADGVWLHLMSPPDQAPLVKAEIQRFDDAAIEKAKRENPAFNAHLPLFPLYREIFIKRPSGEWLEDLWANDVAVEAAAPFGQLYFDQQARLNNNVLEVDDPQWGRVLQPGSPILTSPPPQLRWPCRTAGADTKEVLGELPAQLTAGKPVGEQRLPAKPLAGLKVLDLGNFLAGPLATMLLADMGAQVIKLEATSGDMMRWAQWAFCGCSRGKRSIAADLKHPESRPILERLVQWADVVHHNLRMPAAAKLGLDYASLKAINPDIIYCHVSAYGAQGPRRNWPGYDQMMQAATGWEVATAGEGNTPVWLRYGMMDHLCAMSSVLATLLALFDRERGGGGQFVSASLLGAAVVTLGETMGLPDGGVLPSAGVDALQLGTGPQHRLYQCEDGWIVARFSDKETFSAWEQSLDAACVGEIELRLASTPRQQVLAGITTAGGQGAPVRTAGDTHFLDDPEFRKLGLAVSYPHPVYGNFEQAGALWHFEDMPLEFDRAAPTLGQHSTDILREQQFSEQEIEQFLAQKIVVETQRVV
jgi:crotonobetainyl-CoA:carnitine CoA-transferase CaiB-like acyl-CoA transferase